ncbi:MAG: flotillin-like protein FloA [Candidatus Cardinium sp.]|nr:flotillin-like protein FloA [Candidatus Cardinium sp.]
MDFDYMYFYFYSFAFVVFFFLFIHFFPIGLWVTARFSGVKVGLFELVSMRIRKVPPRVIVEGLIIATKAGLRLTTTEIETHYLAGGHVPSVIKALISADKANISLSFKEATAIDLAGRDVFEAVQISVNPKVIDTPSVSAVAMDGIELIAKARVTVRANIHKLVGGAGEETILARVGEGIVTSIGSAAAHKEVLANPNSISNLVVERGLDEGTAFQILSIDIADIDVGENIGAKLQIDQANADLRVAEAKAEERRAMAVALEQEMKAQSEQARATVTLAEAEVPQALAAALRNGNLGIMDYYRMQNIKADTHMRTAVATDKPLPTE